MIRRGLSAGRERVMASKIKSPPKADNGGARAGEDAETLPDSPLLDLSDAAVKKLIRNAKKRGYVTHEQINSVLPSDEVNSEQIEGVLALFNEMGVNLIESEDAEPEEDEQREEPEEEEEEASGGGQIVEVKRSPLAKVEKAPPPDRTDDPVRMYLREMGTVELLSREGEIAIAKRIEAGREAMISGLCESPLTFQAIIIWRDELNEGKILLRDIIDIEASNAGPDAKAALAPAIGPDGAPLVGVVPPQMPPTAASFRTSGAGRQGEEMPAGETQGESEIDEDEMESSLAAIEAELKPKVLE